jgi:hypothetical protein
MVVSLLGPVWGGVPGQAGAGPAGISDAGFPQDLHFVSQGDQYYPEDELNLIHVLATACSSTAFRALLRRSTLILTERITEANGGVLIGYRKKGALFSLWQNT